jgi:hypothetical protein
MKIQFILFAALVAFAAAQEATGAEEPAQPTINDDAKAGADEEADKRVMAAVTTTNTAIAATEKKVVEEKTACENEVKGTDAWLALIDEKKLAAMRARRIRDKKNLLEAIKERVTVMKDYLKKLQLARNKLVGVIGRVNTIYGASYDEAISTQKSAARIMTLLGLSIGHKYNPGSEFSKIKLPREDAEEANTDDKDLDKDSQKAVAVEKSETKEEETGDAIDCPDCQKKDVKEAADVSLMELEAQVHEQVARCKGEYCETAYHAAFDLYKGAHLNAQADFKNFQSDKKILVNFRTVVSKLITRKEGRLANLTKQADALEEALAKAEGEGKGPLMKIIDEIEVHKANIIAACKVMGGRSKEMIAELEALKSCAEGKACGASDSKSELDSKKVAPATTSDKAGETEAAVKAATGAEEEKKSAATGAEESAASGAEEQKSAVNAVFDADAEATKKD